MKLFRCPTNTSPAIDVRTLWRRDKKRCRICRRPIRLREVVLDHIIPKGALGNIDDRESNLQAAHRVCNARRGAGLLPAQVRLSAPVPTPPVQLLPPHWYKCLRCGRQWYPRPGSDGVLRKPSQCPKCHSMRWDRAK